MAARRDHDRTDALAIQGAIEVERGANGKHDRCVDQEPPVLAQVRRR